jgi:hypothetical protein
MNSQSVSLIHKLPGVNASQAKANDVRLNCCVIDVDFGVRSDFSRKGRRRACGLEQNCLGPRIRTQASPVRMEFTHRLGDPMLISCAWFSCVLSQSLVFVLAHE